MPKLFHPFSTRMERLMFDLTLFSALSIQFFVENRRPEFGQFPSFGSRPFVPCFVFQLRRYKPEFVKLAPVKYREFARFLAIRAANDISPRSQNSPILAAAEFPFSPLFRGAG